MSNLLNQDESQYAYKTPMTTMCGSGNLSMLMIYGTWTRKIGEYKPVLVKDAKTKNITVKFQQVPPELLHEEIFSQAVEMFGPDKTDKDGETKTKEKGKRVGSTNNTKR